MTLFKTCTVLRGSSNSLAMQILRALVICLAIGWHAVAAYAAVTVTISPAGYVAIPAGGTVQFSATVSGTSNTAVTWAVAGHASTNGTISASGLYTAPATAPANAVEITATSVASPSSSAQQFIYFLSPGPTLTQVTPNPLPIGSAAITISGSGLQNGAVLEYGYSSSSTVQTGTTFVNSNTVTASVYNNLQGTIVLYVINPGSGPSNVLAVPVGGQAAPTYSLTVVNGTGSGNYTAGTPVTITANAAPAGQAFSSWTGATVASSTAPSTTLTMPAANTTVTATYVAVPSFFTVTYNANGATSGFAPSDPNQYSAGQPVTVVGNLGYLFNPGNAFTGWNTAADGSGTFYGPGASFNMGSAKVTLYAQWTAQNWPVSIWGGARNAITLKPDGSVWTWGYNTHGQLGDGTNVDKSFPVQVLGQGGNGYLTGITHVMGGELHNLALKNDGTVWAWGMNMLDQLGDGNATDSWTPVEVSGLSNITQIASRAYHSLAVKSDGTVWAWGWDFHGALGNGVSDQNYDYTSPVQVQGLNNPIMVSAGYCYSVALLQDHTLVAWGLNSDGQLGDGTTNDHYTPMPVQGLNNVIWVSAGWAQVVAIKSDGTVWTWGANNWQGAFSGSGLLGNGTTVDSYTPQQVPGLAGAIQGFGGDSFSAVLLHDGSVWAFGSNGAGQLGTGSFTPAESLVPVEVQGLGNVVMFTARDHHAQAIRADGTIWSWGSGENGELGNGTTQNSAVPVEVLFGGSVTQTYQLTVVNGSGSGTYAAGTPVTITANAAPAGQAFDGWTGAAVASSSSPTTTLTMPPANTTVTANFGTVSVKISPSGYIAIPGGGTVQFTATVTGTANTAVTWSVPGSAAANGTVTAGGLYTAPAVTPANPVPVTATSVASPASTATQFVYFLAPGPTVTSVMPSPIPLGTTTFTVNGSGFQNGALIDVSFGGSPVQLAATFVNTQTLTATGYFGTAGTALIYVVNPGTAPSNSVAVPISGPPLYTLTVVNGTGSGSYGAGSPVTITAGAPPAGEAFSNWTGAAVTNPNAATTTLIMPAANTTVTANFAVPPPTYLLTVNGGTGGGNYAAGIVVTITATVPAGEQFDGWTGAAVANPNAATTTFTMPAAPAAVTATFGPITYSLTVVNGTGSGNYQAGQVVPISANAPPSGQYFNSWTGGPTILNVANVNQPSTTVTMPAQNMTVTASFSASTPIPFPVTTHPRLWVTPADVARLQSWAVPGNLVYQGFSGVVGGAIGNYQEAFPGAALTDKNPTPANPFPDLGDTQGYQGILVEENAMLLAFESMIDPSVTNRQAYAQAARNLIMYGIAQAAQGHLAGAPFRDPQFLTFNRGSFSGCDWPLTIDWIYNATDANGNAILTAADKALVQKVFLMWSNDMNNEGYSPQIGTEFMNSLALFPNGQPNRYASNNYFLAHERTLTMMGLALDPADDPPVNPALAPSAIGNTERSYILLGNGAWLYETYAMMGEPAQVAADYGIPNNPTGAGFGLASGGLPPEGMLYGESYGYVLGDLLALETSGFNNVAYSGPQIHLIGAPVWDRWVKGFLSSFVPACGISATESYLGQVCPMAAYGDLLRLYATPDFVRPFALLALLEQENGETTHLNEAQWMAVDAVEGGAAQLYQRIVDPWTWGAMDSLLDFLLLGPNPPAPMDPRPNYPTMFYDAPAGRIVAHTDWTPNGTMFDYRASWITINHQDGAGGMFGLYRNGEWLTKPMSNYDSIGNGETTTYNNTISLQNWCALCSSVPVWQFQDLPIWVNGSQWMEGENAGDPTTQMSSGASYVYANSDLTKLYNKSAGETYADPNHPGNWLATDPIANVTQATRSILWLNTPASDFIVTYDRATTINTGLFKIYNLALVTNPVTTGNTTTEAMPDGQQLFIQTLLPAQPSITSFNGAELLDPIADLEPTQYILQVADPNLPADTRFLHVLEGSNPGVPMAPATYLESASGTAFDGAQFASTAVFFPHSTSAGFTGATFQLPAGVHTVYVTGLTPGGGYGVNAMPGGSGETVTVSVGGSTVADAAGVLVVSY